jgi:hypothetical protein
MSTREATQVQILEELRDLEPSRWSEVLDFIGYLKTATARVRPPAQELTARDLLQSGLVGLWADRDDIDDSLSFARQIRQEAEHRRRVTDGTA